jgi:hypothetical protein
MAIAMLEFDGVKYSGYREIAEKNKDVNRHSLEINAGKAHVKQGGSEINFRYKGHAVRIVYQGKNSAVWPVVVDNYTIPMKKAVEKVESVIGGKTVPASMQEMAERELSLHAEVWELQKAQIRTASRLKKLENESFALRKIIAEIQGGSDE